MDLSPHDKSFKPESNILQNGTHKHPPKQALHSKIWAKIKHSLQEAWDGTKNTYQDYKFTKNLIYNKQIITESYTAYELQKIRRIKRDAFKLVPFSFFLIIPALEIFIPFYLMILYPFYLVPTPSPPTTSRPSSRPSARP